MIHPLCSQRPPSRSNRQRGSIIVPAAFAIIVGIALLGSAQLGYVFYMKRELQSAADLAALSSVQVLNAIQPARCVEATAAAKASGIANFPRMAGALAGSEVDATCARWDPTHWQNPTKLDPTGLYIFGPHPELGQDANAMHVKINKSIPAIMPNPFGSGAPTVIQAEAVATTNAPTASFSVGSRLLALKIAGLDISSGYPGLVSLKTTPSELLALLKIDPEADVTVGSTGSLVSAKNISIGGLLDATASIASRSGNDLASGEISFIQDAISTGKIKISNPSINLFGTTAGASLFGSVQGGARDAALNAQVDALSLINTGVGIATPGQALDLSASILGGLVTVKLGLVEPPTVGIGGVGTTAYNAQVRLFLSLHLDLSNIPLLPLVLDFPISIDLADGLGTLTALDCSQPTRRAEITVQSSLLRMCAGNITLSDAFSKTDVCTGLGKHDILTLFGTPLIQSPGTKPLTLALAQQSSPLVFLVDSPDALPQTLTTNGAIDLSPLLQGITSSLLGLTASFVPVDASKNNNPPENVTKSASILAQIYLEQSKNSSGAYDPTAVVKLLRSGFTSGSTTYPPLPDWTVTKGVPSPCLILGTCWNDGPVWDGFKSSVSVGGGGLLGGLLNLLLGGLVLNNCGGVFTVLSDTVNACILDNLASYLRTSPTGLIGAVDDRTPVSCGILCKLLGPVVNGVLTPTAGLLSSLLSSVLNSLAQPPLALKIGATDVTLMNLTCAKPRLVY